MSIKLTTLALLLAPLLPLPQLLRTGDKFFLAVQNPDMWKRWCPRASRTGDIERILVFGGPRPQGTSRDLDPSQTLRAPR